MQKRWWLVALVGLLIAAGFALFTMGWVQVEVVNEVAGREVGTKIKFNGQNQTYPKRGGGLSYLRHDLHHWLV